MGIHNSNNNRVKPFPLDQDTETQRGDTSFKPRPLRSSNARSHPMVLCSAFSPPDLLTHFQSSPSHPVTPGTDPVHCPTWAPGPGPPRWVRPKRRTTLRLKGGGREVGGFFPSPSLPGCGISGWATPYPHGSNLSPCPFRHEAGNGLPRCLSTGSLSLPCGMSTLPTPF